MQLFIVGPPKTKGLPGDGQPFLNKLQGESPDYGKEAVYVTRPLLMLTPP